jgi:hypothetical protein
MFLQTDKGKISLVKLATLLGTVPFQALSAASLALTGALTAASATLTGALSAASASLTGALSAASATLTGALAAASGSITGALTVGSLKINSVPVWTSVIKTADESLTGNNTYQDDDALTFAVAANTKYRFRLVVFYTAATAGDIKFQLTGPSSPTVFYSALFAQGPDATSLGTVNWSAFSTSQAILAASNQPGMIWIEGILHNGANAGNVTLQWAQNTASGTTTVRAGSYVEYSLLS